MKNSDLHLLTGILLGCLLPGISPGDTPRFEHLTTEDGLSHVTIWDIVQDRRGFLWLATSGGLDRYDGHRFKPYLRDPDDPDSLSGSPITDLLADRQGYLWIATRGRGVHRLDPRTERVTHYEQDLDDPSSLLGMLAWGLWQDRSGALWVGTEAGLSRLDPETGRFTRYTHDPSDPSLPVDDVSEVLEDTHGNLWVGTGSAGLLRRSPDAAGFVRYQHDPGDPSSLPDNFVTVLFEDSRDRLWVGTDNGLALFDHVLNAFIPYPWGSHGRRVIFSISEARSGEIWVGTGDGLYLLLETNPDGANPDGAKRFVRLSHDPDDYLTKPLSKRELLARVKTHLDLLVVHRREAEKVQTLEGLLPICCQCKKIRDDGGSWTEIELYVRDRSEAEFSLQS